MTRKLIRSRAVNGRTETSSQYWPLEQDALQSICNFTVPYMSPSQLRVRLDRGEPVRTKYGSTYVVQP